MKDVKFIFEKYVLGQHPDSKHYESQVVKKLKRVRGELFIDIGAHSLFYSRLLADNFDRIIAYEPNRNVQNIDYPMNIEIRRTALSNHQGRELFYCYNNGGADSLIHDFDYRVAKRRYAPQQIGPFGNVIDTFPVEVDTYDHSVHAQADLAKIDVEGAELQVLEGITMFPPQNILVESHDYRRDAKLVEALKMKGYKVKRLTASHWLGEQ
jgi:FkbM family methyltransferase